MQTSLSITVPSGHSQPSDIGNGQVEGASVSMHVGGQGDVRKLYVVPGGQSYAEIQS